MLDISDPPPPRDRLWEREVMFPCPSVGSGTRGPAVGKWLPFSANTGWSSSCFSSSFFRMLQVVSVDTLTSDTLWKSKIVNIFCKFIGRKKSARCRSFTSLNASSAVHSHDSPAASSFSWKPAGIFIAQVFAVRLSGCAKGRTEYH